MLRTKLLVSAAGLGLLATLGTTATPASAAPPPMATSVATPTAPSVTPESIGEEGMTTGPVRTELRRIAGSDTAVATWCRYFDGYRRERAKTWPNGILFDWHHRFDVCYNGSVVQWVNENYYYVTNRDFTYYDRGLKSSSLGTPNHWSLNSYMRGEMEQCLLKWGCVFGTFYPYVSITAYGNGTAAFSVGEG